MLFKILLAAKKLARMKPISYSFRLSEAITFL